VTPARLIGQKTQQWAAADGTLVVECRVGRPTRVPLRTSIRVSEMVAETYARNALSPVDALLSLPPSANTIVAATARYRWLRARPRSEPLWFFLLSVRATEG